MSKITIGEHLYEDFMVPEGETCESLASTLGVSLDKIQKVIQQNGELDEELARRLDEYYGLSPGFWMRLNERCEEQEAIMSNELTKGEELFCLLQLPDPSEHSLLVWHDGVSQEKKDNIEDAAATLLQDHRADDYNLGRTLFMLLSRGEGDGAERLKAFNEGHPEMKNFLEAVAKDFLTANGRGESEEEDHE